MNSLTNLKMKLKELDDIEKDVAQALNSAGQALTELSRDKPTIKLVEGNTSTFLKTLQNVESSLSKHIIYLSQVSTVQPHEGSSYAAQKVFHMALHRLEHARSRMNELERVRQQHLSQDLQFGPPMPPQQMPPQQQQQQLMRGPSQQQGQQGAMGSGVPQQGMMMQPGMGQDMGQQGMQMGQQGPMDSPLGPGMGQAMGQAMGQTMPQGMGQGMAMGSGMGHNMGQAQQMNQMGGAMGGQQMMWQQNQLGMGQQMGMGSMGPGSNMGQSPIP